MKKKILLFIIFIMTIFAGTTNVLAKNVIKLKECEYSDEYIEYLKLDDEQRKNTIMPQMCKSNLYGTSSYQLKNPLGDANASSFDLRKLNKITSVKDQRVTGFCWAFAATADIESNLLVKGFGKYDLSESHIELSSQNTFKLNYNTFNRAFNSGGTAYMSSAYVMNHKGPVLESEVPFSIGEDLVKNNSTSFDTSNITNKKAKIDVNDVEFIYGTKGSCSKDTSFTTQVKKYLVTNGAITGTMFFDGNFTNYETINNKNILYSNSMAGPYYYYSGDSIPNHAITIVGWDDTISKDNFREGNRPSENGAWIVKNSYGTSNVMNTPAGDLEMAMGDDGYYYVSYEDNNICNMATGFYNADTEVDDNAYYYDELGANYVFQSTKDIYAGTIFNKKTNKNEKLTKVTFFANLTDVDYEVYYDSIGNFKNPVKIASGIVDHVGYVTVYPNKDIIINNDKYSIIVKYSTKNNGGTTYSVIPAMIKSTNSNDFYSTAVITNEATYISVDMKNWADLAEDYNVNSTIRAYTKNVAQSSTTTTTKTTTTNNNNNEDNKNEEEKDEGVNDNASVEITPNENNGESYISTPENPKTSDFHANIIIVAILLLILIITMGIKKIGRKNSYE